MTAVVHIVGMVVQIGSRMRQRCEWCGALLIDYDLDRIAVPVGQEGSPSSWPIGELVRVDGNASYTVPLAEGERLPADACGWLDPEVTR